MSSFTARNLSDDELEIEEHTRELQIEIAIVILNKALNFQKIGNFADARLKYDELGRLEIISNIELSNNKTPIITRIKYLWCRNRGFLRIQELVDSQKHNGGSKDDDEDVEVGVYGEIIGAVNDLVNAMMYGTPDEKTVLMLASIFTQFGYVRLARLCYEMKVVELDERLMLLNESKIVNGYIEVCQSLGIAESKTCLKLADMLRRSKFRDLVGVKKLDWDTLIDKETWSKEREVKESVLELQIDVDCDKHVDLNKFWESWSTVTHKPKGKNKYPDSYLVSEKKVDDFKVVFTQLEEEDDEDGDIDGGTEQTQNESTQETHNTVIDTDPAPIQCLKTEPTNSAVSLTREADESKESITEDKFEDALETQPIPATQTQLATQPEPSQPLARPMRNLRGKVELTENTDAIADEVKNLDMFVSKILPDVLTHFDINVNLQSTVSGVIDNDPIKLDDKLIQKFYTYIANWDDEAMQSLHIMDHSKNNKTNSIHELLNIQSNKTISAKSYTVSNTLGLYDLLSTVSDSKLHFTSIRSNLFEFFVSLDQQNSYNSIITTNKCNKKSIKTFKLLVDTVSISYYNTFQHELLYNTGISISQLNISISILETLVDSYLEFINDQKLKKSNLKSVNDIQFFESTTTKRINLWIDLIEDSFAINQSNDEVRMYLWSKYKWLQITYIQINTETINSNQLINWLSQMIKTFKGKKYYQPFVNYEYIPVLNLENIENQYSKLKILEIFNKNDKSNEILESILLGIGNEDGSPEIKLQLTNFIEGANLQMKLRLWSLLLRYYQLNNNHANYKKSYEKILNILMEQLQATDSMNIEDSKLKVLNIVGFFTFFTKQFIEIFCESDNMKDISDHDVEISKSIVTSATKLLHMFYIVLMYQKSVNIDGRSNNLAKSKKSAELLNDSISCCFFLISSYISNPESNKHPEIVNDLLSMCHVHLGFRNRCSSLNGNFLKFLQFKMSQFDFKISANDVFQIIHCRFGFPVTIEKFETFDHKCKPKKLEMLDAIQLSEYISTYCFRGKHPILSPPKSDLKTIIDNIVDVVGNVGTNNPEMKKNRIILNNYLTDTKLDLEFILRVFKGEFQLDFANPEFPGIELARCGIYYLQGLVGINSFKVRKRTVQSRVSELEPVSRILKRDLYSGCNRFETWVSLGQYYSYMVEDDLIWTADKLNSVERKQVTALSQRKSLLCFLMAISIYIKADELTKKSYQPVLHLLWDSFAKELYSSWMQPMNKKAFHTVEMTRINEVGKKVDEIVSIPNDIPESVILKLLELSFASAFKNDDTNWYDLMYLAKSKHKLRMQPQIKENAIDVIDLLISSCKLAYENGNKDDPVIEPHYYLFSMINKSYWSGYISTLEAIGKFQQDPLFQTIFDDETDDVPFKRVIMKVLEKLINYDKKNWQHRPVYRLAKIYCDVFNDINHAKVEMLSLVNLKPTVRSLSTIWKPAIERPGKHFIYNSTYTRFLVELLYKLGDIYSLMVLLKKIRRAGVIMVNLTKTFDDMTLRICTLLKKSISLQNGYLEDVLAKINYKDFMKYSPQFITKMKDNETFDKKSLLNLYFISEMQIFRKLATGFGATSLIDEVFHSIYLKLFVPFLFKKLVTERNGGDKLSSILHKSKEFKLDKIFTDHKARLSTPDLSGEPAPVVSNTESAETMDVDIWDVDREISEEEQILAIGYLGFKDILNSPSKDKIKMARRDVSPFAVKLVIMTTKAVDKYKEETDDGESIEYGITGKLDDDELQKVASLLNSKETKENKEEKEFEKLTSQHERNLEDSELNEINQILVNFNVEKLVYYVEPIEEKTCTDSNVSKTPVDSEIPKIEAISEPGDTKNVITGMTAEEMRKAVSTSIAEAIVNVEAARSSVPTESSTTPPVLIENSVVVDKTMKSVDVETKEVDDVSGQLEPVTLFPPKDAETVTDKTEVDKDSGNSTILNNNPFDDKVSLVNTNIDKFNIDIDTPKIKDKAVSKSNSPAKQSVITSFFKVSPEKLVSTPKRSSPEMQGSPEPKKRKLIDEDEEIDRYRQSLPAGSVPGSSESVVSDKSTVVHQRRNSRRQMGREKLIELDKSGAVKQQKDVKKLNAEIVNVLSDSDDSSDSIIVID